MSERLWKVGEHRIMLRWNEGELPTHIVLNAELETVASMIEITKALEKRDWSSKVGGKLSLGLVPVKSKTEARELIETFTKAVNAYWDIKAELEP